MMRARRTQIEAVASMARGNAPLISLIAVALIVVLIHLPTLAQPLLEVHAFRQTQTAWTALVYHENGIDLLRPMVPVLGPPYVLPFEFPLFQALASLVMNVGVAPDVAMRLTCLATFVFTMVVVFRLAQHVAGNVAAVVAALAFAFSAYGMIWSRTSMIEYLAAGAALLWVLLALRWSESGGKWRYAFALLAGAIAMLVKITTAVLFVVPIAALVLVLVARRQGRPSWPGEAVALAALVAIPFLTGFAWTAYADSVKAASDSTAWLTSANVSGWSFGTMGQRLDLHTWLVVGYRVSQLITGGVVAAALLGIAALIAGWRSSYRLFLGALVAGAVLGPLVFTNLYLVHDYYLIAASPQAAIAVGLGGAWVLRQRSRNVGRILAAICVGAWMFNFVLTADYWMPQYQGTIDPNVLPAAALIDANSDPGEAVVVAARDWDPAVLYYARRYGFMVWGDMGSSLERALSDPLLTKLRGLGYKKVFHCPLAPSGCEQVVDLTSDPPAVRPLAP